MLAFDDAAHARLVIAATAIPGRARLPPRPRIVSERLISLKAPTKYRRRCSMPPPRHRHRHGPEPDRRRALELLASSRDGATEAIMRAHGFTVEQMVELVRAGLAARQRSSASRRAGAR